MALVFVQDGAEVWVVQIHPGNHAPDEIMLAGQLEMVSGVVLGADHYRAFETIAFQDGEEEFRRVSGGKVLVGIQAQRKGLENETQAAAEAARGFDQEDLLAARHTERQIALRQQIPQIGGRFHPPR